MRSVILWVAGAAALIYVIGGVALFLLQRQFIYPIHLVPVAMREPPPPFRRVTIDTADGEKLRAWHTAARSDAPTILLLHGNGDTLEALAPRLRALAQRGYGVLGVAFRGYPGSSGSPSESGLIADAAAAVAWLIANGVADNRIVLHGRSLGSGPATAVAADRRVGALILESPYTSVLDMARRQFPIYPARLLLRDRYDSIGRIGDVRSPILFVHGRNDGLIPPDMAQTLHDRTRADVRKALIFVDGAGHNDLDDFGLVDMIDRFLREMFPR